MIKICCDNCNKELFETELTSKGAIGSVAQQKGFVYKIASLFSDKYSSLYFCNHDCGKAFYDKNIPKNSELQNKINELKKEIPEMAKECCKGLDKIQKAFNSVIR